MSDKFIMTWDMVETAVANLLPQLHRAKLIVDIARGGLVPAVMLSNRLGIPMAMVEASSYTADHKRGKLNINISSTVVMRSSETKHVTIVDDILDTGITMAAIQPVWSHSTVVVLVSKKPDALVPHRFAIQVPPETWVVFPWE